LTGNPKVADSSIYADTNTFKNFGGFNYDSLTKLATSDKQFAPSGGTTIAQRQPVFNGDGSCAKSDLRNWGDTSRVAGPAGCREYYPVVWLKDKTATWTLNGDGGQGILLVDGNLAIAGQFNWTGLIIVQGTISFSGNKTPKLVGAVLAMNRNNGTNAVSGTPMIQFSRCAIQAVTARLSTARLSKYRAWADMAI
jgi:hypothetical protein